MVSTLFFSQLVLVALGWLCVMLHWAWPSAPVAVRSTPRRTSARTRTGPIGAAGAGAISAPTAIPMGAPGANGGASPGAALCSRPSTRSRRASAPPANSSWASSRAWTQAWGSGAPPVLHALRVRRVQRDELCALLRAVQDGLVSTAFSARSDRIQSRERERGVMQTQRKRASMPAFATGSPRRTREVRGRRADQANRVIGPVCALDTHLCAADVPGAAPRRRGAHPLNHAAARRGRPRHDQRDIWARNL